MNINQRKPDWFKVRVPSGAKLKAVSQILQAHRMHSICVEGLCPNRDECWNAGTATFLILGDTCTRHCKYCNVKTGKPPEYDLDEPKRLRDAVKELKLDYVVVTSVTRDDLPDGGAAMYAETIGLLREIGVKVEVLIPDFKYNWTDLQTVINAKPDVLGHNIEVVKELYKQVRPGGDYDQSLELLARVGESGKTVSKTAFMVGVGETIEQIWALLADLHRANVQRLAVGQYLRPTKENWEVAKYYTPAEFGEIKQKALEMGFEHVESGPLVRSSYHAEKAEKNGH